MITTMFVILFFRVAAQCEKSNQSKIKKKCFGKKWKMKKNACIIPFLCVFQLKEYRSFFLFIFIFNHFKETRNNMSNKNILFTQFALKLRWPTSKKFTDTQRLI